jgi:hypothetical protein
MGKKILLVLVLFIVLLQTINAQNEKNFFFSSGGAFNKTSETIRVGWINDFGITKNNNVYKLGLITQLYTNNAESLSESVKISGTHLGYGKILPSAKKWLSFELKSDLNIQHFKSVWNSNLYNKELQQYQEYEYKLGETIVDLSAGYGLRINATKRFFISQSFTGGVYYSRINSDELSPGAPEIPDGDLDFRAYGNTGLQWSVQLGLGFVFGK